MIEVSTLVVHGPSQEAAAILLGTGDTSKDHPPVNSRRDSLVSRLSTRDELAIPVFISATYPTSGKPGNETRREVP